MSVSHMRKFAQENQPKEPQRQREKKATANRIMGGNENYPPNYIIRDEQKHEGHVTVINLQKCRCMNKIAYTYARVEQELLLVTFPKR